MTGLLVVLEKAFASRGGPYARFSGSSLSWFQLPSCRATEEQMAPPLTSWQWWWTIMTWG